MERLQAEIFDGSVPSELSGEFILPDTYPDVKRILRVNARPIELGRFISGSTVELSGAVDYIVLFCADSDGAESLHSVHFAADYKCTVAPDGIFDNVGVITAPRVLTCTARLSNPRKLSLKATVITDVKLVSESSTKPSLEGGQCELEKLNETLSTLIECETAADHERISENLEPDPSQPAIDELVTCDVQLSFYEVKPQMSDGGLSIALKGEALIDCIYKAQTEAGDHRSFSRKLPLSFIVNADECAESFSKAIPGTLCASARGLPTEINASVGENSYGERRVVELDLSFDVISRLFADSETVITLDAYSTEYECECERERLELSRLGKAVCANFSVNESISREELALVSEPEAVISIIDSQASVSMNSASIDRGRVQLNGEAELMCVASVNNELQPLSFKLPIRCELSAGEISEPLKLECFGNASDVRVRLDPTRIYADFEVTLCAVLLRRERRVMVKGVKLGDERQAREKDASTMILCYPSADEGLWQVAKRYGTTVAALEEANRGRDGKAVRIKLEG